MASVQDLLDIGRSSLTSNSVVSTAVGLALGFRYGKEPQAAYMWDVDLPKINGLEPPIVLSTSIPFSKLSTDTFYVNANKINLPLSVETDNIQMTILLDSDGKAIEYIESWKDSIRNPKTGTYSYSSEFKKNIKINLLSKSLLSVNFIESTKVKAVEISLEGVFPIGISDLPLDYKSSEAVTLTVDFSVDNSIVKRNIGITEKGINQIKSKVKDFLST